jgi:integrase
MPKVARELSAIEVQRLAREPPDTRPFNYFPVGGAPGLLLRVAKSGACYWVLRISTGTKITAAGKKAPHRRDVGLGAYPSVSLKVARERASQKRNEARDGIDPVEARREARRSRQAHLEQRMTFAQAVELARELESIKNDKAGKAWAHKLETFALPALGTVPIAQIERANIVEVLKPIWSTKTRTAKDVRKLIESVLDRAYATKNIARHNPARWDKLLRDALPKETRKGTNFPALPFTRIHEFLKRLAAVEGSAARAVEFVIYTGSRSGEVRGATWGEIDLDHKLWTIPAERMKKGEEHRVPLSAPALAILEAMPRGGPQSPVFPTQTGRHHKDDRLSMVVRAINEEMGNVTATVHGFRATFRTWGEEETDYPEAILEMALAHKIDDAVKAAYQRGELLKKRRALLDDWALYCSTPGPAGSVVKLRAKA